MFLHILSEFSFRTSGQRYLYAGWFMIFDKYSETALELLFEAYSIAKRFRQEQITGEHLLASIAADTESVAGRALVAMNVSSESIQQELERELLSSKKQEIAKAEKAEIEVFSLNLEELKFKFSARLILKRAAEIRVFFGHHLVEPEHLLLAILDIQDENCKRVLEEIGANIVYLNRILMGYVSERDAVYPETPALKQTIIDGFEEMVDARVLVVEDIERLAAVTDTQLADLPQKSEIAHLIFTAYMPDFLFIQVGYRRYLLEETLNILRRRVGQLDAEIAAAVVSQSAQHLRGELRQTMEHIWSHEFRLLSKLPEEADYDLIGSVIEDLWWTHSEEIALHQVYDNALDDHRRQQMLSLQKRRLEISERFGKLRVRLAECIKQCFSKRSVSA